MSQLPLILASSSPQRQKLLQDAGYRFEVWPPHDSAEYGLCSNCGPAELVVDLAMRKAANVVTQLQESERPSGPAWVVACDTVAECDGQILGKPRDEDHARSMLRGLRGRHHRVYSGLCLWPWQLNGKSPDYRVALASSQLVMDELSDQEIENYLASELWRGKAGAFGLQDRPGWFKIVSGSESNVIGLPLDTLEEMLTSI